MSHSLRFDYSNKQFLAGFCYGTVGVHPCQAKLFDEYPAGPSKMLEELKTLALESKQAGLAVAFGEIGLDYDRLFLSAKESQLKYFEAQLDLAVEIQLPLFLHSRAASEDFEKLLAPRLPKLPKRGLVHSFTGTLEEMQRMVDLGLDIGVNGCSLKTEENLEVVKTIPLDRIQIETDGPWVSNILHLSSIPSINVSSSLTSPCSARSVLLMRRPSTWRVHRHCPRRLRRRNGRRDVWSRAGMNQSLSFTSLMSSLASKVYLWRKFVKRTYMVLVDFFSFLLLTVSYSAWRNSIKMFGLGEEA